MNFKGHAIGGLCAGAVAAMVGIVTSQGVNLPQPVADVSGPFPGGFIYATGCFGSAFLMALFPDLDTNSIPQRWYLRWMFGALILSAWVGWLELFVVLAFLALLPLLHRHRGWTHWPITPWAVAILLVVAYEYAETRSAWFSRFSWQNVGTMLAEGWAFVFSCVLGHYTHLLLDSRRVRWLPFIRNGASHH